MRYPVLDHIGIAVREDHPVVEVLHRLIGRLPYAREVVASQGLEAVFVGAGTARLELLKPVDASSPVTRFLEKRGEGVHHLAFEVPDIEVTYRTVQEMGFTPLGPPAAGAQGKRIFFLHPRETHGVLVEFCQKDAYPLHPRYWDRGNVRLAWYALGNPEHPSVLLLHGALGSVMLELLPLMLALAPDYYVVAPDLPGHGNSGDLPPTAATPEALTRLLLAFIRDVLPEPTFLFGFSMGGHLALRLTPELPIRAVALHATHGLWPDPLRRRVLRRFEPDFIERHPKWLEAFEKIHGPRWRVTAARLKEGLSHPNAPLHPEALERLTLPVLISGGSRDELFPPDVMLDFARHFPQADVLLFPGKGHTLEDLPTEWLRPVLTDFFEQTLYR